MWCSGLTLPANVFAELAAASADLTGAPGPFSFLLDFDGTIAPIVAVPSRARTHPSMAVVLERIASRARLSIISGRPVGFLSEQLAFLRETNGAENVELFGQYGLVRADLTGRVIAMANLDAGQLAILEEIRHQWLEAPVDGILFEDKGSSLAFHYRNAPAMKEILLDWIDSVLPNHGLSAMAGKMVYEIAPESAPSKRTAALSILQHGVPCVFAGDDYGDLEVFQIMHEQRLSGEPRVAILVQGGAETPPELLGLSDVHARDQDELAFVLDQLLRVGSPL